MTPAELTRQAEQPRRWRYPGPRPFEDADASLFFGRDAEASALAEMIEVRRQVVVFGQSGMGKTSLLQAGVFKRLREQHFLPLRARVNTKLEQKAGDLATAVIEQIEQQAHAQGIVINPLGGRASLWEFFKGSAFWRGEFLLTPVLVLDQFEELFTQQDAAARQAFGIALGDLVGGRVPVALRELQAAGATPKFSDTPPDVRVVMSLREEWVGTLDALFPELPGILSDRFRVVSLSGEQAQHAIEAPAALIDESFFTPAFSYAAETLTVIKTFLQSRDTVEPFQLQVICQFIEREIAARAAGGKDSTVVDASIVASEETLKRVTRGFFLSALKSAFPRTLRDWQPRRAAQRLCERGLLTRSGGRDHLSGERIAHDFGLDRTQMGRLVDLHLVRADERGAVSDYEISHDSLAKAIHRKVLLEIPRWVARLAIGVVIVALAFGLWRANDARRQSQRAQLEMEKQMATSLAAQSELERLLGLDAKLIREPKMVVIPAGDYLRGSKKNTVPSEEDERPQRKVTIAAFELSVYEVTFDQYDQFALATGRTPPADEGWGRGQRPAINVSWDDATAYAAWLSKKTNKRYRLPTESEWEYAARAGTTGARFWSKASTDDTRDACKYANVANAATKEKYSFLPDVFPCEDYNLETAEVNDSRFKANGWGLYQMLGNVWEWTADCYKDSYEGAPVDGAVQTGEQDCPRVIRGGSWNNGPVNVRAANRLRDSRNTQVNGVGIRLARTLP